MNMDYKNILHGLRLWSSLNFNIGDQLGPLSLEISFANICNFRCLFCSTHSYLLEKKAESFVLPRENIEQLKKDIRYLKIPIIKICGQGEQLLFPQTIDFIESLSRSKGLYLTTNGSTLDKITYDIFKRFHRLTISLNSVDPITHKMIHGYHGETKYNDILNNIKRLLSYPNAKDIIRINFAIMNENINEIDQMLELGLELNIPFRIQPMYPHIPKCKSHEVSLSDRTLLLEKIDERMKRYSGTQHSMAETLAHIKTSFTHFDLTYDNQVKWLRPCYAGFYGGFISSSGNYRLCCSCSDSFGNIREQSFLEIWQSPKAKKARYKAALMDITNDPICNNCFNCQQTLVYSRMFHSFYSKIPFQRKLLLGKLLSLEQR